MLTATAAVSLVLAASGLISKIRKTAEKASHNKEERDHLAVRLSAIDKLLPRLEQQVPETEKVLAGLCDALTDAHELVDACQNWSARRKFTRASVLAERFSEVNRRIDSYINLFQLHCTVDVTLYSAPLATTTASCSLTVATTARRGHRIRKRDLIKSFSRVTIGVLFNKPKYIVRGASAFLK